MESGPRERACTACGWSRSRAPGRASPAWCWAATPDSIGEFTPQGADRWFRLFLPQPSQGEPVLPFGGTAGWHARLRDLHEDVRPACRNYTVCRSMHEGGRRLVEVDLVLHRDAGGALTGPAAMWADRAKVGDAVGFLDQGAIVVPPPAVLARLLTRGARRVRSAIVSGVVSTRSLALAAQATGWG